MKEGRTYSITEEIIGPKILMVRLYLCKYCFLYADDIDVIRQHIWEKHL